VLALSTEPHCTNTSLHMLLSLLLPCTMLAPPPEPLEMSTALAPQGKYTPQRTDTTPDSTLPVFLPLTNTAHTDTAALDPPLTCTAPPSDLDQLPLPTSTSPDTPAAVKTDWTDTVPD
jgi:hypothetical protein